MYLNEVSFEGSEIASTGEHALEYMDMIIRSRKYRSDKPPQHYVDEALQALDLLAKAYVKLLNQKKVDVVAEVLAESKARAEGMHESALMCLIETLVLAGKLNQGDALNDIFSRYLKRLVRETPAEQVLASEMLGTFVLHMEHTPDTAVKLQALSDFHAVAEPHHGRRDNPVVQHYRRAINHLPRLKNVQGFQEFHAEVSELSDPHVRRVLQAVDDPKYDKGQQLEPVLGQITLFAGNFAPAGWAFCHGQLLSIRQHQALYSLLGVAFGGDGRTTFALPDLRGCSPLGSSSSSMPGGPNTTANNIPPRGQAGGSASLVLTKDQLPAHTHAVEGFSNIKGYKPVSLAVVNGVGGNASATAATPNGNVLANGTPSSSPPLLAYANIGTTSPVNPLGGVSGGEVTAVKLGKGSTLSTGTMGGGAPVATMPPYLSLNFIIAIQAVYT